MKSDYSIVLLVLLAACSHDANRENPLDPVLTPGVQLTVAVNDTAGTAALTWSRYDGMQPFVAYLILRNVTNTTVVDTLGRITEADSVAFIDASLAFDTSYQYRVSVTNSGGFSAQSPAIQTRALTPSVRGPLSARTDSTAGTITLSWARYRGPGFAAYRIHRRPTGTDRDSVLTHVAAVTDTVFVDSAAMHEAAYSYQIVVETGGQELTGGTVEARLSLRGASITRLQFASTRAAAELAWSPYAGPRFAAYRVERSDGAASQALAIIEDVAVNALVDSALLGAKRYEYHVVVLTDRGEEISSPGADGGIHPLVTTWNVASASESRMRLRSRSGGGVEALVSSPRDIRLLMYDESGQLLEEQVLLTIPGGDFAGIKTRFVIEPRSVETILAPDGERLLLLKPTNGDVTALLRFDAGGEPLTSVTEFLADESLPIGVQRSAVKAAELVAGVEGTVVRFGNVAISASEIGQRLSFNDGVGEWHFASSIAQGTDGNYLQSRFVELIDDALFYHGVSSNSSFVFVAGIGDESWTDVRIATDLMLLDSGIAGVRVGYVPGPRIYFTIDSYEQLARLRWWANASEQAPAFFRDFETPLPVIPGLTYRVSLGGADSEPIATVVSPIRWYADADPDAESATLSVVGETVAITSGAKAYSLGPDGQALAYDAFETPVSEMRVWPTGQGQSMGVALPFEHRIAFSRTSVSLVNSRVSFPGLFGTSEIGAGLGNGAGEFAFPVSFDVASDGRFYVLDAANSRIQVFDSDGAYITHWGAPGSDAGDFDFSPAGGADFAGSIAVDDDGFIYVADVGNGRIQKFAP